jgi:hypothetical protein
VRLRVVRIPRVGPPAATCSSIVFAFAGRERAGCGAAGSVAAVGPVGAFVVR